MKVSVAKTALSTALQMVRRAIASRTTMPVLSNVMLEASDDRLYLTATNREISVRCWIDADVIDEGKTTMPARLMADYTDGMQGARVEMALNSKTETLALKSGGSTGSLKGINAMDFPMIDRITLEPNVMRSLFEVKGDSGFLKDKFIAAVTAVNTSASTDESRPTFTGISMTFEDGHLTMATTDSYRLTRMILPGIREISEISDEGKTTVLVPARAVVDACAVVAGLTSPKLHIAIMPQNSQIGFSAEGSGEVLGAEVIMQTLSDKFPDYKNVIPRSSLTQVVISVDALAKAVKQTVLFSKDHNYIVEVHVDNSPNGDGRVRTRSVLAELGNNVEEVEAKVTGAEVQIKFNGQYIQAALANIKSPKVLVELSGPNRPAQMFPYMDGNPQSESLFILMPMQPR